jgi:uncharacterized protein YecE (DUF72 family)
MKKIYAGTSGWAYSSWKPAFYPQKLASSGFLSYYAGRLNSVEVNYTFRRLLAPKLAKEWIRATPAGFLFAVKAHQAITHFKRLRDARSETRKFLGSLRPLVKAGKLGPVLFQLPPNFKSDLGRLEKFLSGLPRELRFSFEFRHPSWFTEDVYDVLRGFKVALCLAESDEFTTPEVTTAKFSYLRLRREKYSPRALAKVAARVKVLRRRGDVFVYFKHEDTPEGARYAESLIRLR